MSRRGWMLFIALCIIWGLPYLMIKVAIREVDPATLVLLRTAPVAFVLLPWCAATDRLRPLRPVMGWIALYALCEFGVPWLFMGSAEQRLSSSMTALLVAMVPILAVILYRLTHPREVIGATRILGLIIGTAGVALLVGLSVGGTSTLGIIEMGIVVVGYTLGPFIISPRLPDASGPGIVAVSVALVAIAYLPFGVTHLPAHLSLETIGAIAVLALVCTAGGFLALIALTREVGPARATVVTYVNPAVAIALGVVFLGEQITIGMVIGFPLIIVGSVLATSRGAGSIEPAP